MRCFRQMNERRKVGAAIRDLAAPEGRISPTNAGAAGHSRDREPLGGVEPPSGVSRINRAGEAKASERVRKE
jgi:hypothetical protein